MTKQEFLSSLSQGLNGLPRNDIEERLGFYGEMIDDRIEEGFSEVEAVEGIGSVEKIISQIIADTPLLKIAKEKIKPKRRLKVLEFVLLILGSPIWLSLLIAVFAVAFSLYISIWSLLVSLWAVFASIIACAFSGITAGIGIAVSGKTPIGIALIGVGIICAGLSILLFFGSLSATNGVCILTKKACLWTKNCFINKGEARI